MTYRAFRYSGIFFWLLKTGFVLKNTKSGWKSGLKNTIVNAINLPFFSFSTHVKGLESAARSCCLLCSVFSFLPFITGRFCVLCTSEVYLMNCSGQHPLAAGDATTFGQCNTEIKPTSFFKIKQETAVKSCENLWNRTPPKLNKYFCLCECVTLHTLACFLLLTKQDSLTGSALVISTEFVGECSFSKVGNFVICANLCVSIFGTDALFAVIHFPCRLDFHKNYSW